MTGAGDFDVPGRSLERPIASPSTIVAGFRPHTGHDVVPVNALCRFLCV